MPDLYIIAGPNGAGKTTASFTILPQIFNCREFVNADELQEVFLLLTPKMFLSKQEELCCKELNS